MLQLSAEHKTSSKTSRNSCGGTTAPGLFSRAGGWRTWHENSLWSSKTICIDEAITVTPERQSKQQKLLIGWHKSNLLHKMICVCPAILFSNVLHSLLFDKSNPMSTKKFAGNMKTGKWPIFGKVATRCCNSWTSKARAATTLHITFIGLLYCMLFFWLLNHFE